MGRATPSITASSGLLFLLAAVAAGQTREPEVFGYVGVFRAGGDEGSNGAGPVAGGSVMLPVRAGFAIEGEYLAGRSGRDSSAILEHEVTRHLVSANALYRKGNGRHYFFAGGGVGMQRESSRLQFEDPGRPDLFGARPLRPGVFEVTNVDSGMTVNLRAGFVATLRGQWLLRGEYFQIHRYVLPNAGVKVGIGYRFRR